MASTAPQDNGGSLRKSIGLIELFTFWTCEPIRPAQAFQIGSAGGIIGKNPLKIGKRCWKAAGVHSGKLSPIHRIGNKPDRQGSYLRTLRDLRRCLKRGAGPLEQWADGGPDQSMSNQAGHLWPRRRRTAPRPVCTFRDTLEGAARILDPLL